MALALYRACLDGQYSSFTEHAACSFQTEGLIESNIWSPRQHEARWESNMEKMESTVPRAYWLLFLLSWQNAYKKQLRKGRFILDNHKGAVHCGRKAWQQKHEEASHMDSTPGDRRDEPGTETFHSVEILPRGWHHPYSGKVSLQLNLSGNTLIDTARSIFPPLF